MAIDTEQLPKLGAAVKTFHIGRDKDREAIRNLLAGQEDAYQELWKGYKADAKGIAELYENVLKRAIAQTDDEPTREKDADDINVFYNLLAAADINDTVNRLLLAHHINANLAFLLKDLFKQDHVTNFVTLGEEGDGLIEDPDDQTNEARKAFTQKLRTLFENKDHTLELMDHCPELFQQLPKAYLIRLAKNHIEVAYKIFEDRKLRMHVCEGDNNRDSLIEIYGYHREQNEGAGDLRLADKLVEKFKQTQWQPGNWNANNKNAIQDDLIALANYAKTGIMQGYNTNSNFTKSFFPYDNTTSQVQSNIEYITSKNTKHTIKNLEHFKRLGQNQNDLWRIFRVADAGHINEAFEDAMQYCPIGLKNILSDLAKCQDVIRREKIQEQAQIKEKIPQTLGAQNNYGNEQYDATENLQKFIFKHDLDEATKQANVALLTENSEICFALYESYPENLTTLLEYAEDPIVFLENQEKHINSANEETKNRYFNAIFAADISDQQNPHFIELLNFTIENNKSWLQTKFTKVADYQNLEEKPELDESRIGEQYIKNLATKRICERIFNFKSLNLGDNQESYRENLEKFMLKHRATTEKLYKTQHTDDNNDKTFGKNLTNLLDDIASDQTNFLNKLNIDQQALHDAACKSLNVAYMTMENKTLRKHVCSKLENGHHNYDNWVSIYEQHKPDLHLADWLIKEVPKAVRELQANDHWKQQVKTLKDGDKTSIITKFLAITPENDSDEAQEKATKIKEKNLKYLTNISHCGKVSFAEVAREYYANNDRVKPENLTELLNHADEPIQFLNRQMRFLKQEHGSNLNFFNAILASDKAKPEGKHFLPLLEFAYGKYAGSHENKTWLVTMLKDAARKEAGIEPDGTELYKKAVENMQANLFTNSKNDELKRYICSHKSTMIPAIFDMTDLNEEQKVAVYKNIEKLTELADHPTNFIREIKSYIPAEAALKAFAYYATKIGGELEPNKITKSAFKNLFNKSFKKKIFSLLGQNGEAQFTPETKADFTACLNNDEARKRFYKMPKELFKALVLKLDNQDCFKKIAADKYLWSKLERACTKKPGWFASNEDKRLAEGETRTNFVGLYDKSLEFEARHKTNGNLIELIKSHAFNNQGFVSQANPQKDPQINQILNNGFCEALSQDLTSIKRFALAKRFTKFAIYCIKNNFNGLVHDDAADNVEVINFLYSTPIQQALADYEATLSDENINLLLNKVDTNRLNNIINNHQQLHDKIVANNDLLKESNLDSKEGFLAFANIFLVNTESKNKFIIKLINKDRKYIVWLESINENGQFADILKQFPSENDESPSEETQQIVESSSTSQPQKLAQNLPALIASFLTDTQEVADEDRAKVISFINTLGQLDFSKIQQYLNSSNPSKALTMIDNPSNNTQKNVTFILSHGDSSVLFSVTKASEGTKITLKLLKDNKPTGELTEYFIKSNAQLTQSCEQAPNANQTTGSSKEVMLKQTDNLLDIISKASKLTPELTSHIANANEKLASALQKNALSFTPEIALNLVSNIDVQKKQVPLVKELLQKHQKLQLEKSDILSLAKDNNYIVLIVRKNSDNPETLKAIFEQCDASNLSKLFATQNLAITSLLRTHADAINAPALLKLYSENELSQTFVQNAVNKNSDFRNGLLEIAETAQDVINILSIHDKATPQAQQAIMEKIVKKCKANKALLTNYLKEEDSTTRHDLLCRAFKVDQELLELVLNKYKLSALVNKASKSVETSQATLNKQTTSTPSTPDKVNVDISEPSSPSTPIVDTTTITHSPPSSPVFISTGLPNGDSPAPPSFVDTSTISSGSPKSPSFVQTDISGSEPSSPTFVNLHTESPPSSPSFVDLHTESPYGSPKKS